MADFVLDETLLRRLAVASDARQVVADLHLTAAEIEEAIRRHASWSEADVDALQQLLEVAVTIDLSHLAAHSTADSQLQVEHQQNLQRRLLICEKAEQLQDSNDWVNTAAALKALQAEWKTIGPVTRGAESAAASRFRSACDLFMARRQTDLIQRKQAWRENAARKEAIVAEAKKLVTSPDWQRSRDRMEQLQKAWMTIGPVRKHESERLWQEFRAARKQVFERKGSDRHRRLSDRESAVVQLEALAQSTENSRAPDNLYNKVQLARARWSNGRELPSPLTAPLARRMNAALFTLATRWPNVFKGTDLDPERTKAMIERLIAKVDRLLPAKDRARTQRLSPREHLGPKRQQGLEDALQQVRTAWADLGPLSPEELKLAQRRLKYALQKASKRRERATRA